MVNLGADAYFAENFSNISEDEAGYYGQVPASGPNRMYLGSKADIPTIVHEFGHVIDKSKGFTAYLTEAIGPDGESRIYVESRKYGEIHSTDHIEEFGNLGSEYYTFNLDTFVYREIIEGFVAKQYFVQELWADLFMTAVLNPEVSGAHLAWIPLMISEIISRSLMTLPIRRGPFSGVTQTRRVLN